jgi:hypothetical protein
MLTWENTPIQGTAAIMEKLSVRLPFKPIQAHLEGDILAIRLDMVEKHTEQQSLPFSKVVHRVLTLDAQPAAPGAGSIIVLVTGQLLVDDGANVLQYAQMFHVSFSPHLVLLLYWHLICGASCLSARKRADDSSSPREAASLSKTTSSDCELPHHH